MQGRPWPELERRQQWVMSQPGVGRGDGPASGDCREGRRVLAPEMAASLCPGVEVGWVRDRSNHLQSVCRARSSEDNSLVTGKAVTAAASGESVLLNSGFEFFFFLFHLKSLNEPSC